MLYVPAYTHECRPYSDTLYPTSLNLDSLPAQKALRPAQDLWSVFHLGPYGLWGIFSVTVCFGTIGEGDLLGNQWAHRWIQQTLEQY